MKKFLCSILAAALLLTSAMPAFATESVNMRESDFTTIMNEFADGMPGDPMERILIWKTFKAYMLDGSNGIDKLISVLDGTGDTSVFDSNMQAIFDRFVTPIQPTYRKQFIFMLQLYKNTALADRAEALENFGSVPTDAGIIKTPMTLTSAQQTAADAIYNTYIPDLTAQAKLAYHSLGSANFLNLITPFKGCFKMTNDASGNFVLASYSDAFAAGISDDVDFVSINNTDIDSGATDAVRAYQILTGVVKMFNSFTSQRENLKVVLAHNEINLYQPNLAPLENPGEGTTPSLPDGPTGPTGPSRPVGDRYDDDKTDTGFNPSAPSYDATTPTFSDVEANSWAAPYIMNLTERKIFAGYDDGSFRPDTYITRQEIAVAMVRAMGLEADVSAAETVDTGFADDAAIASWARGYVNIALREKLFTGYDDGEFKPERVISRQELIAVIMRLAGSDESVEANYADAHEIHGYAKDFVGHASSLGIVNGYPDGTFKPLNFVTRAEVAKILYLGLEYLDFNN